MKINRTCCNALIGTEQEQINQLYEFVKALAGNYFEGFEIMGTYSPTVNYNKKYMLVFFEGSTYIKTVDGDSVNFSPALNPDKWALFSSGTPADLSDLERVIEGSDTVVVDVNEAGTALEIHADYENVVRPLERALKKPISNPTETVLAGVDAQGEQVLLPVSSVGGGTKIYKYDVNCIIGGYNEEVGPDYDNSDDIHSGPFSISAYTTNNITPPTLDGTNTSSETLVNFLTQVVALSISGNISAQTSDLGANNGIVISSSFLEYANLTVYFGSEINIKKISRYRTATGSITKTTLL